jgi:hypothetical protein
LVLGRDGELGPISPNEIDDLLEQMTARPEASTSNSVFPEGGAVKEKFCEETPSEAEEVVDPRYTSRYTIALPMMYFP